MSSKPIALSLLAAVILGGCAPSAEDPEPAAGIFEQTNLWEAGTLGYAQFRIPALVSTAKGSLLAFAEARKEESSDWGNIDIMMRRSTDGGKSWGEPRVITHVDGEIRQNAVALVQDLAQPGEVTYNNPAPIIDRKTGAVHFLFCVEYARAYYLRSDDDGQSFSQPADITAAFEEFRKDYAWKVIATGPGHGIQLENGRLIVPVWLSTGTGGHAHRPSVNSVVYSDDHGATWHAGDIAAGETNPKNPSETLALQLADGRVVLNMRNENPEHLRALSFSDDGATGWTRPVFDDELNEPVCMASLIRLTKMPESDKNRILFVNPDSHEPRDPNNPDGNLVRQNVSVRLSYDEGETWPIKKVIEPGSSGYSDMTVGPDGMIHVLYESHSLGDGYYIKNLTLASFDVSWVTDGADSL
jgi:sialidase-1